MTRKRRRRRVPRPDLPSGYGQWKAESYEIASPYSEPERVDGYTLNGLGIHLMMATKAKYVRKDGTRKVWRTWSITHLNTGHAVRGIKDMPIEKVFEVATDLAGLTDWDFDGFDGWRNADPEIPDKLQAWHQRHELGARIGGGGRSEAQAQAIGSGRW